MITCSKIYTDIPFAHRQHLHAGHCSYIHGHNWSIKLTFACEKLDRHGFVIDFGGLTFIKEWIDANLDHACVFSADDELRDVLVRAAPHAFKVYVVENCSAEGIAQHLFEIFDKMLCEETEGRVFLWELELQEDSKNAAQYCRDKSK